MVESGRGFAADNRAGHALTSERFDLGFGCAVKPTRAAAGA